MIILMAGNPNVGKSAVFSHITGISVTVSNYPGTTVQFSEGFFTFNGERHRIIDLPGTYRLNPESRSEKVASDMIQNGDVILNVVDATNLERNLNLTFELAKYRKPMVIILNMWDDAIHKGIDIDVKALSDTLKVPVITTNGQTGEGLAGLSDAVEKAAAPDISFSDDAEKWSKIGVLVTQVQNLSNRRHTFTEKLQDFSVHPIFGPPAAIILLFLCFKIIIDVGELLIDLTLKIFDLIYTPLILYLGRLLGGGGFFYDIFIGQFSTSADYEGAMGVLTTGVFVALGIVLPFITLFYLVLGFLEDLGYLPRAAVLLDRVLHKIGLHGYSVIPMLLSCGCNVPGILAIRNLESRRERFITAVICCTTIPCMAQTSLIIKVVGKHGMVYLALVFSTLVFVWFILGFILNATVKGVTPTLIMEIPPYRIPNFKMQLKKLYMRLKCFLKEAIPYVLGGILFVNILHVTGVIAVLGEFLKPVISGIFGLPEESVAALIIGTIRKDAAIILLEPFDLNGIKTVTAAIILTLYFPCIATFTVLLKETGIKDTIKAVLLMFTTTLITGGFLNASQALDPLLIVLLQIIFIIVFSYAMKSYLERKKE